MGVYLTHQFHLYGTNQLVRHFRSFLRQDEYKLAYNPESDYREPMNRDYAQRRIKFLIHTAINRKAGISTPKADLTGLYRERHQIERIRKLIKWGYVTKAEVINSLKTRQSFYYRDDEEQFGIWPGLTGARVLRKLLEKTS